MYFDPSIDYRTVRSKGYIPGGFVTRLFFSLLGPLRRFRAPRAFPGTCRRIVVIRLGGIGDAILATSIVPALTEAFPGCRIDVVCCRAGESAFRSNPMIGEIFSSSMLDAMDLREMARRFSWKELLRAGRFLRGADVVFHLNKIVSIGGFLLYAALALGSRSALHVGRDTDGRGIHLDVPVTDRGFLLKHEVEAVRNLLEQIGLGAHRDAVRPILRSAPEDKEAVERLLPAPIRSSGYLVVHPGSSGKGWRVLKRLPIDVWEELLGGILERSGFAIVLVGASDDRDLSLEIVRRLSGRNGSGSRIADVTGKTSLTALFELISRARGFLGTDSGVAHIAGCTNTPGAVTFTFSDHIGYRPWNPRIEVVRNDLPCSPCIYWQGYLRCKEMECGIIPPEDLLAGLRMDIASNPWGGQARISE